MVGPAEDMLRQYNQLWQVPTGKEDNGDLTRPASWLPAQPNALSLPTETSHAARREAAKLRACWPLLFHMAHRALQLPQVSPQRVAE